MDTLATVIVILTVVPFVDGQCTFPDSFNGTWITSYDGTWTTNSTHLLNYKAISPSGVFLNAPNPTLDFTCFIKDGTKYVLRSADQVELFTGFFVYMHTCIDLQEVTSTKYVYYYGTVAESTGLRFTALNTVADVCTQTNHDLAYNQHLALRNGSETSGLTLCPPSIYGSYFYNTCNDSNSNTTSMDVCDSRQQLIYNYTLCNTLQMFTSEGVLDCLFYADIDTVSYVTLYNRDSTTPDGSTTYQFVCLAIELSGSTVYITANPETCTENQSPTNISSPGQIIQFTPFYLCPFTSEDSSFDFLPFILGGVGLILLILLIIIIVCCCKICKRRKRRRRKKRKKKKKRDEEEGTSDDDDTDDDSSSRSSDSRSTSESSVKSSQQYVAQEVEHEEKKSVDSGISEPTVTHRTISKGDDGEEDGQTEKELVINDDGELELDDKTSRPQSGQRSRMSDLPPSTLPEDEQPGTSRSDPEEQRVEEDEHGEQINKEKHGSEVDTCEQEIENEDPEIYGENEEDNVKEEERESVRKDTPVEEHTQEQLKEQLQETIEEQDENQDQEEKQSITSDDKIDANANNEEKSDEKEEREGSKLNEYKTVQHEQNDVDVDTDGGEEEEDDEEGEEEEDEEEGEEEEDEEEREEEDEAQEEDEEEDEEEEKEELQTQQQQQQSGEEDEEEDEEDEEEEEEENSDINVGHENDAVLDKKENGSSQMSVKGESNEDNAEVIVGMADENRHIKDDHERKQEKVLIKADADQQKHSDSEVNMRNEDENNADKGDYENSLEGDKAKSVNGQEQQEGLGFVEANRHDNKSVKSDHEDNQHDTNVKINDNQTERTNNYEEKTAESDQEDAEGEHQGEPQSESKDEHTGATEADQNEEPQIHDNTGEEIFSKDNTSERSILVVQQPIQADREQNKEHDRKEERRETDEKEEEERESEPEVKDKERDVVDKHSERDGEKVKKTSKKYQRQPSLEEETTREYSKIGGKKEKDVQRVKPLTTVLISRKEEEKKRMKNREKSKSHKMRRLARNKTHKFGPQGGKDDDIVADEDELMFSSDDEMKPGGGRSAPFIAQYNNKKRIEHILDQQHYWSDPDAEKESFGLNESMTHVFGDIVSESGSDYEELVGPDGVVYRVKRSNHTDDRDGIDSEPVGTKRAKSFDSLASVEDPESPEGHVSKKRLSVPDTRKDENEQSENLETGQAKEDSSEAANKGKSKTRMIYVKENVTDDKKRTAKPKSRDVDKDGVESDVPSDFCDTDMDKLSERDSGLDDELEDAVDVVLNKDQQAMIVAMLFDEEMNLRPQFGRDDDGRIIRRLDNTVIYDPHTGRFTFHKQLGKIFNLPRLRRNSKGRPIGGYVEDPFGPHESDVQRRTPSSKVQYRTASGKSIRSHVSSETGSPSPDMKRSRGEGKYVGFVMPDDDADTLTSDQLDVHIRGRRDIGSAIRRKLNKRLFRKKRKMPATTSALPNVSPRRAWTQDGTPNGQDMTMGPRGLSTLSIPYSRSGTAYGTPGSQRRPLGNTNLEQQQMFKQGLERDRKILEERQDMLNKKASGQDDDDNSVDLEDENRENDVNRPVFDTSQSFYTDDGRLVVRERGCPDLKRPSTLFTIVRRQEDLEGETPRDLNEDNNYSNTNRNCKSAPSFAKPAERQPYNKENTFHVMRHDGSESQLSGIDNNRLRRLLEELYRDKKYFDEYIQSKEPESEEFVHSKGLAEHGRGYLMERAEYWERRGPLPPKPPMTEIGWKMYRQQTMMESRLNSDRGSLTLTGTSDEQQHNSLPGVVDCQENGHNNGGNNESYA